MGLQSVTRRQHHRFRQPELAIELNGEPGMTKDWSLGGVAVSLAKEALSGIKLRDEVSGMLGQEGSPTHHDWSGRIVRIDKERNVVAIEFERLSEGAVMMFVNFFRTMMSGAA